MLLTITLDNLKKMQRFVDINEDTPCKVNVISGKYTLNAKSLMNLFALNLFSPVTLMVKGSQNEMNALVQKYERAGFC